MKTKRKDSITETEIILYRKAVEKHGNHWRKVVAYFVKHKELLNDTVAQKYDKAFNGEVEGVKSIRSRIGNLGRKVKNSKEVKHREERFLLQPEHNKLEDIVLQMKKMKKMTLRTQSTNVWNLIIL